jgi:hypothetical protein
MLLITLGCHQGRLAQPAADRGKERAEEVQPLLALQFPQINVEVDRIGRVWAEDRQYRRVRPHPQIHRLPCEDNLRLSDPATPPSRYSQAQLLDRTRSNTACQSATETPLTLISGRAPIKSGSKKFLTSFHHRSDTPPCCRRPPYSLTPTPIGCLGP